MAHGGCYQICLTEAGLWDVRQEKQLWLIQAAASEKSVVGGRQDCHARLCRLCRLCTAQILIYILIMMVFQQMAVKCLVLFLNLHKMMFGLAKMLVSGSCQ